jgi:hypothetical protein
MINFEDLRIGNGEPLDKDKWNGLLDWVLENPFNLTDQKLSLKHFESDLQVQLVAQRDFGLLETPDARPLSINPSQGRVGIGTTTPEGALQVVGTNQDANGDALVLGSKNQSNLRLGYHSGYSWIQSHGSRPLTINPLHSNVGIGNTNPGKKLEVTGEIVTRTSIATGAASMLSVSTAGVGTLWTNNAYNPGLPGSGWVRAINMKDGKVGLGAEINPAFPLSLGSSLAKTKLALYQSTDGASFYGMGVTAGRFYFNIGNPQAQYIFLDSAQSNAKEIVNIKGNGDIVAKDFLKTSDRNVKKDIRPFQNGLEIVEKMSPVSYQYNGLGDTAEGSEEIGLIAQDLENIAPFLVAKNRRKLRPADTEETDLLNIKPMGIIYILVNAVKELNREIQELKMLT